MPNGPVDIATFASSLQTSVMLTQSTEVAAIVFQPGAAAFTINDILSTNDLTLSGTGIQNNSGIEQSFVVGALETGNEILFTNGASAGAGNLFTVNAGLKSGGQGGGVSFQGNASAGQSSYLTKSCPVSDGFNLGGGYGYVQFSEGSTAAEGTFTNEGSHFTNSPGGATFFNGALAGDGTFINQPGTVADAAGGVTQLILSSSAERGTFINNGATVAGAHAGKTQFYDSSTPAESLLIANGGSNGGDGGSIYFQGSAISSTARCQIFGNGSLDIEFSFPSVAIGSLEGDGQTLIGSTTLIVGSNNLSTTFSGTFAGDGAFQKVGSGTLTLAGVSDFFIGPKTVVQGTLVAAQDNVLGTGDAFVRAGAILSLKGGAQNNNIADTAQLHLVDGALVVLDFTGPPESVVGLTINGIAQDDGLYGPIGSGAANERPEFTGTGTLLVAPPPPLQLLNISTRLQVQTGDGVLIGGFIISGTAPKQVLIRGIGPSLLDLGLSGALLDPVLELHGADGKIIETNDDWKDTQSSAIKATGIAPTDDRESAILQTLAPDSYTAVLRGKGSASRIGLVEIYDLDQRVDSSLANISTRGFVDQGDGVLIGGTILGPNDGAGPVSIVIRALGPSLEKLGLTGTLPDPVLTAYNENGAVIQSNNDWEMPPSPEIEENGLAPGDPRESVLELLLGPGSYTAIVSGKEGGTGIALVEFYNLH